MEKLALLGGKPVIEKEPEKLFKWPIIGKEDEDAALEVIRNNSYSGTDITEKFQDEFAEWIGRKYAVAYCNGTASLAAAMFAVGLGKGDEMICPTKTYWASAAQATALGASVVFCNVDPNTLCIDPDDIERCISPRTKAIMVVHYYSHPADMDRIMPIAKKHNLIVIEDVSHAQGGHYKGKKVGTFGDIAAMSLMSGKSFAAGELGIFVTDDRRMYERGLAYGHYDKNNENYIIESEDLKPYYHIPLGAVKGRANQLCTALARVQLKYYDERIREVRRAMNYFCDLIADVPGIRVCRANEAEGSDNAGCYGMQAVYHPEELSGLSVKKFAQAIRAEGYDKCWEGGNHPLHKHMYFKTFDFFNEGKPTRTANNDRDLLAEDEKCAPSEEIGCMTIPRFSYFDKEWIEKYAEIFRKVAENYEQLLETDEKAKQGGRWYGQENEQN